MCQARQGPGELNFLDARKTSKWIPLQICSYTKNINVQLKAFKVVGGTKNISHSE